MADRFGEEGVGELGVWSLGVTVVEVAVIMRELLSLFVGEWW